jgi:hypothetical protein
LSRDSPTSLTDHSWNELYRVGGAAALAAVVVVIIEAFLLYVVWPPPSTTLGLLNLFQSNRLAGLLDKALLDVVVSALLFPVFLALYVALREAKKTWVTVATPLALAGIAAWWATNQSFNLLFLSEQYAAATTDAQRSQLLASAQAVNAIDQYGMFYSMGFMLVAVAGLLISIAMLRSSVFGRATAWVGVVSNLLTIGNYVILAFVSTASIVSLILVFGGGILMFVWWILTGTGLYRLGQGITKE